MCICNGVAYTYLKQKPGGKQSTQDAYCIPKGDVSVLTCANTRTSSYRYTNRIFIFPNCKNWITWPSLCIFTLAAGTVSEFWQARGYTEVFPDFIMNYAKEGMYKNLTQHSN